MTDRPFIIAGAGIAGLTAALMLARQGRAIALVEKRTRIDEVGAGLQISPNASRILIALGLGPALSRVAGEPTELIVRDGKSGATLGGMAQGQAMRDAYGAPYWHIHRADLQTVLLDAVRADPNIHLSFGRSIIGLKDDADGLRIDTETASGARTPIEGAALIGADGLWTRTAALLGDGSEPRFTGYTAWRAAIPMDAAPAPFRANATGLWLGPQAHLVHYPLRGGRVLNIVAVVSDRSAEPGWSRPGDKQSCETRFRHWATPVRELLSTVPEWTIWSLYDRPPRPNAARGRATLIGDAFHPVLPFLAQGAAMAIEDCAVLAHEVAKTDDIAAAFRTYAAIRAPRVQRVQREARKNGRLYHLSAPFSWARNFGLQSMNDAAMARRYEWLYGWAD
jgi:salicylate hydroxylase